MTKLTKGQQIFYKNWDMIKESMKADIDDVKAEDVESMTFTRGLYNFKIEINCKVPESETGGKSI